jgi:hypothetical protein
VPPDSLNGRQSQTLQSPGDDAHEKACGCSSADGFCRHRISAGADLSIASYHARGSVPARRIDRCGSAQNANRARFAREAIGMLVKEIANIHSLTFAKGQGISAKIAFRSILIFWNGGR